ncbi:MAG: aminotransferase class I/II-fold pyridoxal phosphate-dependent enzyme [Actinomycetota bacterium]
MTEQTASLAARPWIPEPSAALIQSIAEETATADGVTIGATIEQLITDNTTIHDRDCINLNPATNTMSPRAEAALAQGLGSRTSLGYAGAKYEMGLEAIERIEVVCAELAARVFGAPFVEIRVPSGAMANLYAFMACAEPGDAVIVPPGSIAGHVTHHRAGAAGLYGLEIHEAPIDPDRYTIDVAELAALAATTRPKVISVGSSLNIHHHDVTGIRAVADEVGATVLFDAAHLSGVIAGGAWPNPLERGAQLVTMSTYKSLGGPTAGLIMTTDPSLAERIEAIAFPGLTANFDAGNTAALALTLADWLEYGVAYAEAMTAAAAVLAAALADRGVPVARFDAVHTRSHAFAIDVRAFGGGQATAERLRSANLLTSAIGLPSGPDDGLRVGTNELVRWGATATDMAPLADLIAAALAAGDPSEVAADVTAFRSRFTEVQYAIR